MRGGTNPTSEKRILAEGLIAVTAEPETLVFRNNTGTAWQGTRLQLHPGQTVVIRPGMIVLQEARPITFGLPGSADIMGVCRGRAVALEAKTSIGRQSDQQRKFEAAWTRAGGVYGVFRSADEALAIVRGGL